MSAEQGHASAQFNLALCYVDGTGVVKDLAKAVKYYQMSAEQGDAGAQYNLAIHYEEGTGVDRDLAKALEYYKAAAAQGHLKAIEVLRSLDK